jgi:hypothetical protein
MKGKLHPTNDVTINPSGNESVRDVIARTDASRRSFLKTSLSAPVLAAMGGVPLSGLLDTLGAAVPAGAGFAGIGFPSIPAARAPLSDVVGVPPGYQVDLVVAWGDPIMAGAPAFAGNASESAADQEKQYGQHTDGMHYFPSPENPNARGLLVTNNEYTQETIHHTDGLDAATGGLSGSVVTIAKVRKSQAAHGVSVVEISKEATGKWQVNRNSPFGRRITANTPMTISGPASGHPLLRSKLYDIMASGSVDTGQMTDGARTWGTANNCAHGYTPWGTYVTCEENWNGYFGWKSSSKQPTKLENRYGVSRNGFSYKWHQVDDRWDADLNPNGPNQFGWKVEIDPWDPTSTPVKRTSMGRFKCESAGLAVDPDHRFAFYMGDDERNEYVYKWVCNKPWVPGDPAANKDLLDDGILYVARFTSDPGASPGTFKGVWVPLLPDTDSVVDSSSSPGVKLKLREMAEFSGADDAEVLANILIKTRMAADAVGATMMDRPEWTAVRPRIGGFTNLEVYLTLTNNNRRGSAANATSNDPLGGTGAGSARPAVDAANPRPDNDYGHILRWREAGDKVTATEFEWDIFVLCGDARAAQTPAKTLPGSYVATGHDGYTGNIAGEYGGSSDYGAPDGLWFDQFGRLWIQTDQEGNAEGDWRFIGANQMVCADPNTRQTRRFLTAPPYAEVTGVVNTPDGKSMFVGIQHPGEGSSAANPAEFSNWPRSQFGGPAGRPRSGVVAITRRDGGPIGA